MGKIIVVGSSNVDLTMYVDRMPQPGETVHGNRMTTGIGGKGANQAVAAARGGGKVAMITAVGDDPFGRDILKALRHDKINCRYAARMDGVATGTAMITVAASGQNMIAVAAGANGQLKPEQVQAAEALFKTASYLLLQMEIPVAVSLAAAKLAHRHGVKVVFNPAPALDLVGIRKIMEFSDLVIVNEVEAELLTGIHIEDEIAALKSAQKLHQQGISEVVITLGSHGVYYSERQESAMVPALKVKAVDTVAAGDTFLGAMIAALSNDSTFKDAVKFGNAAAAICVTRPGAQASIPSKKEIEESTNWRHGRYLARTARPTAKVL